MYVPLTLQEDYWNQLKLDEVDLEFIYDYLLELETPMTGRELVAALIEERVRRAKRYLEDQHLSGGGQYLPFHTYSVGSELVFPALEGRRGKVISDRVGYNPQEGEFTVISVQFSGNEIREFATGIETHKLNNPPEIDSHDPLLDPIHVLKYFGDDLEMSLEEELENNHGFVRIAGKWFPRSLLVDINVGHLNLAEAVLDMAGGGPLPTKDLIAELDIPEGVNSNLVDFSIDLALQEDQRFDEVGPAGKVLWFLHRLEPPEVLETPIFLRYSGIDYDRSDLTTELLALERRLDDELSPIGGQFEQLNSVDVPLIFPHLRSGSLPLSARLKHLFPTAYEAPRIRFMLVDGETGSKFPGWVVREKRYIFGLKEWYENNNMMPGSIVVVERGNQPGEVVIHHETRRTRRDWIKTVLVGSDGGIVYAMLKQLITGAIDDRMGIAITNPESLDNLWNQKEKVPFDRMVVNTVRELSRMSPQGNVHAIELYSAINIVRRCPPGPILALLESNPWFLHVGDLHYRLSDSATG